MSASETHELIDLDLPPIKLDDGPSIAMSGFELLDLDDISDSETNDEAALNALEFIQLTKLMAKTAPAWQPLDTVGFIERLETGLAA